ncbi:hypothetical protein CEK29_15175 [Bordetella genomosp. 5]|uniref:Uncharacterized protein n=1 Tax=Bordetella genomosp. 5 TaxID=1395608 RepID=A0A261TFB4_9BORD|nr:hypothetical protein [Bordetella genomosp. 5]OZI41281.1 hypothetical protein CEK29_15175 [Bordetella genomosp. 5]OZI47937.1 hypothetical protein CAL25_16225 [Bordetella genomosp. 5]
MAEKLINGFALVAYATQPEHGIPPRAFIESRRLPPKVDPKAAQADKAQAEAGDADPVEEDVAPEPEAPQAFEIFISRRFRSTVEAMSAARNALDRVRTVDEDGVPDPLPE